MRKLKLSKNPKFNRLVVLFVVLMVFGFEVVGPSVGYIASRKALTLATQARKEAAVHPNQALLDYKVASILSPSNHEFIHNLADQYLKLNRPDDAIATLKRLPKWDSGLQIVDIQRRSGRLEQALKTVGTLDASNPKVLMAKSQVLLEQGKALEAISAAQQALNLASQDISAQLQLGLAYAAGDKDTDLDLLMGSVTSPQALQVLKQARQGKTALSYVLYDQGLIRRARTILMSQPDLASSEQRLLGQINLILSSNDPSKLDEAKSALVKATLSDPANPEAHRLLQQVYTKMGDKDKAAHQGDLVQQLESGKV